MNAGVAAGRVATAVALAAVGAGLRVLWRSARRTRTVPVVRCPIHGIAYDTELEVCPDCARTTGAREKGSEP
jgi:hypothetical protein